MSALITHAEPGAPIAKALEPIDTQQKKPQAVHDVSASQRRSQAAVRQRSATTLASATIAPRQAKLLTAWMAMADLDRHHANECQDPIGDKVLDDTSRELREEALDLALELLGQRMGVSPSPGPTETTSLLTSKNQ